MQFCPSCRADYEAGLSSCPGCGRRLVDRWPLPPAPSHTAAGFGAWVATGACLGALSGASVLIGLFPHPGMGAGYAADLIFAGALFGSVPGLAGGITMGALD